MQVADVMAVFDGFVAKVVGRAVRDAGFDAAAREPEPSAEARNCKGSVASPPHDAVASSVKPG
jgi:hypothetical protein